jgi:hypothetical protein
MRALILVTVAIGIVVVGGCSNSAEQQSNQHKVLSFLCKVGKNGRKLRMSIRSYPKTSFAVIRAVCLPSLFMFCIYAGWRFALFFLPTLHWVWSAAGRVWV